MSTATASEEDVPTLTIIACVLAGISVAGVTFALTFDVLLAMATYVVVACFTYATTWVVR